MVGGLGGPKAESVVMFHHGYTALHACLLCHSEPLGRVGHSCRCECGFVFGAVAPLLAGVCVHAVVEEGVKLGLVPQHLSAARNGKYRTWGVLRIGNIALLQLKLTLFGLSDGIVQQWWKA